MNGNCTSIRRTARGLASGMGILALILSAACSNKQTPTDTTPTEDAADASDDSGASDVGGDDVGTDAVTSDLQPQDAPDVQQPDVPVDIDAGWECDKDPNTECADKFNDVCEDIACTDHKCVKTKKAGANVCCSDSDCATLTCQTKSCNLATGTCEYQIIPSCCPDQQVLLQNESFESQGNLGAFSGKVTTPPNGNVQWQVSNKRSHTGKSSVYLGNECYNYDTSATAANSCQSTGQGAKVVASLSLPLSIPLDPVAKTPKPAILSYWVWLEAEPSYLASGTGITAGTKCPPCGPDQVCAKVADQPNDACLTEPDVLTVQINGQSVTPTVVWASTKLPNKTTNGQWQHHVVNLAGFGGAPTISWVFNTQNGSANQFEGLYLDDIEAKTLCADDDTTCNATKACKKLTDCTITAPGDTAHGACTAFDNVSDSGLCLGDNVAGCCVGVADCADKNGCTVDSCVIEGSNTTGQCSNVPDASNTQCCQPQNLLSDSFENGLGAWTQKLSNSSNVQWRVNPAGGLNGSKALVFTDGSFTSYNDKNIVAGPKGTICAPEVTLKAGTLYNLASFKIRMQTEWCGQPAYKNPNGSQTACKTDGDCTTLGEGCYNGLCSYNGKTDELRVLFLTGGQYCGKSGCSAAPGKVADPLWSSDAILGCADPAFQPQFVALDQYAGKKGQVCFTFDAGDSAGNTFLGVALDDYKLDIACKKTEKPCASDAECDKYCAAGFETGLCLANECAQCQPIPGVCKDNSWCDDKNACTTDTCAGGTCQYATPDPLCCDAQTLVGDQSFEAEKGAGLPTGWTSSPASVPQSLWGTTYDTTLKWQVSGSNYFGENPSDLYSLYFGNPTLLNYEVPQKAAYGLVTSPVMTVPSTGTTLLTFHVALSTEWDPPAVYQPVVIGGQEFPVDRLRIGVVDATDATQISWIWTSASIKGSTSGKWINQAAKVPAQWAGKKVKLAFEFDAGTDKQNNHTGAYIDTVSFYSVCTPPACVTDGDCAPATPDPCILDTCLQDQTSKAFSCAKTFQAGPNCCEPSTPLATASAESSLLAPFQQFSTPGKLVAWNVVPHKYLNGKYEYYFGNPSKYNYDDGGSTTPVSGELDSPVLTLSADPNKTAIVTFTVWADLEQPTASGVHAENFALWAAYGASEVKIWDAYDKTTGLKSNQWKSKQTITVPVPEVLKSQKIILKFKLDSGTDGIDNDKYQGVFLDDIQLQEPCSI